MSVQLASIHHFWGHITLSAHTRALLFRGYVPIDVFSQSEVSNLAHASMQEYILTLDISVDYLSGVSIAQSFTHLSYEFQDLK